MPKQVMFHSGKYRLGRYAGIAMKERVAIYRARVHGSANDTRAKKILITHIGVTIPVPNNLAVHVFWTGEFSKTRMV
jgi:hypothetical protein